MLLSKSEIFIDGGGNFKKGIDKYLPSFNRFFDKIYVFEPNPIFSASYEESNLELIQKAIWIQNGVLPFYLSKDNNQVGSSLLKHKLCRTKDGVLIDDYVGPDFLDLPIEVECIDFSIWLQTNIDPTIHNLTIKLDIEGAEYMVLWKMLKDGTIRLVSRLYVEFHQRHLNISNDEHDKLIDAIKTAGVILEQWD